MSIYTSMQSLESAKVLIEFYYEPYEPPGKEGSRSDGPESGNTFTALRASVNGEWIDVDIFPKHLIEKWEDNIRKEFS